VSRSLEETAAGLRIKRPKNGKARKFRVGQSAIAALRFQPDQQAEHRKLYGPDYKNNLVFSQPYGSYLWPHLVSQAIVRRMRKAGIKDASLHSLRHSHASGLLSKGGPLPAVSARLGHADTNITTGIYSHALPDDDNRAADTWENIVRGPVQ
jgi:integrase